MALLACALLASGLRGAPVATTTIDVSSNVVRPSVKRFGINLGWNNYFDRPILKNLVFRNPGFEGLIFRSVVRCQSGSATGCTDDETQSAWPDGFWNGASFEVVHGAAHGRTGSVTTSTAPQGGMGTVYAFSDSGTALTAGDHLVLRKSETGGAMTGWSPFTSGGGTVDGETVDLPPATEGRQAVRVSATGPGQFASLSAAFDTSTFGSFLRINGGYRLTFKAKGAGGGNALNISFTRQPPAGTTFLNQTLTLTSSWATYDIDFSAGETGLPSGILLLRFTPVTSSAVLLDDVSLTGTGGDPSNATVFRDPVVAALLSFRPGILRYLFDQLGDSLDNQIAPPFARQRSGFRTDSTANRYDLEYGLHEFLELCERVGSEPWFVFSVTYSTQEMRDLIEYLAGPSGAPYGARRAARGRSAPWTQAFSRIHLEFGNEAWNDADYSGATIPDPAAYGSRGGEIFGAARSSPYFDAARFDLVLGGQAAFVGRNMAIHAASSNNDTLAVAPYFGGNITSFANLEELFGPLFAEPEMLENTGYMSQNASFLAASARPVPLAIYEVNLHTTLGTISQAALDSFTPSVGAGLAVADHMLLMLRDLGIADQVLFSLTGFAYLRTDAKVVRLWGTTRDLGMTDRKRPQFLAVKLANDAMDGDLVATTHSGEDPTWDQPLMNTVQYDGAHYLQSYAFAGGSSRSVIVLNLHRTSALSVTFTGVNAPQGAVTLTRLTSAAITDSNEDAENVVTTSQSLIGFDPSQPLSLPPFSMTLLKWQTGSPNTPPTISAGAPISRSRGSSSLATVATVGDLETPGSLTVTAIPGGTATGVSVTGFSIAGGSVSASVAASCTATSGTVRLQVSDLGSLTATADASIIVTANATPPVVTPPSPGTATVTQTSCVGGAGASLVALQARFPAQHAQLSALLNGGSAVDDCTTSPTRLATQLAGQDVVATTRFAVGTSTVQIRYEDADGNVGSASASVTVTPQADLNLDGAVDVFDIVILANFLVGNQAAGTPPFAAPALAADGDGNGAVDLFDLVLLAGFVVGNVACLTP